MDSHEEPNDDVEQTSKPARSKLVAPWANERRFDKLTPEEIKKLCREVAEIQRMQREMGLEQRGPSFT